MSEKSPRVLDPSTYAIIVVDMQNAFIHSKGFLARSGFDASLMQQMAPTLLGFLDQARSIKGLPLIFTQTVIDEWNGPRWPGDSPALLLKPEDWETDYYHVAPQPGERVVKKARYGAFTGTELDLVLRSMGIHTVVMTGVGTNVCVESTAREAYMRGYNVVFLSDCTATTSREEHEATLKNMRTWFGTVTTSEELLSALKQAQSA